jgi:hypothetical protein
MSMELTSTDRITMVGFDDGVLMYVCDLRRHDVTSWVSPSSYRPPLL